MLIGCVSPKILEVAIIHHLKQVFLFLYIIENYF